MTETIKIVEWGQLGKLEAADLKPQLCIAGLKNSRDIDRCVGDIVQKKFEPLLGCPPAIYHDTLPPQHHPNHLLNEVVRSNCSPLGLLYNSLPKILRAEFDNWLRNWRIVIEEPTTQLTRGVNHQEINLDQSINLFILADIRAKHGQWPPLLRGGYNFYFNPRNIHPRPVWLNYRLRDQGQFHLKSTDSNNSSKTRK